MSNSDKLTVTIDRRIWARGVENTRMLNADGTMCCLGFLAATCGVPNAAMLGKVSPSFLYSSVVSRMSRPLPIVSGGWSVFLEPNDDLGLTEEMREKILSERAKEYGFDFVFVG
jgi:hypothetical protein